MENTNKRSIEAIINQNERAKALGFSTLNYVLGEQGEVIAQKVAVNTDKLGEILYVQGGFDKLDKDFFIPNAIEVLEIATDVRNVLYNAVNEVYFNTIVSNFRSLEVRVPGGDEDIWKDLAKKNEYKRLLQSQYKHIEGITVSTQDKFELLKNNPFFNIYNLKCAEGGLEIPAEKTNVGNFMGLLAGLVEVFVKYFKEVQHEYCVLLASDKDEARILSSLLSTRYSAQWQILKFIEIADKVSWELKESNLVQFTGEFLLEMLNYGEIHFSKMDKQWYAKNMREVIIPALSMELTDLGELPKKMWGMLFGELRSEYIAGEVHYNSWLNKLSELGFNSADLMESKDIYTLLWLQDLAKFMKGMYVDNKNEADKLLKGQINEKIAQLIKIGINYKFVGFDDIRSLLSVGKGQRGENLYFVLKLFLKLNTGDIKHSQKDRASATGLRDYIHMLSNINFTKKELQKVSVGVGDSTLRLLFRLLYAYGNLIKGRLRDDCIEQYREYDGETLFLVSYIENEDFKLNVKQINHMYNQVWSDLVGMWEGTTVSYDGQQKIVLNYYNIEKYVEDLRDKMRTVGYYKKDNALDIGRYKLENPLDTLYWLSADKEGKVGISTERDMQRLLDL